jgi:pyruvate dehydrogenase E2 component (dihydrolipoamide acetyltransferase)/2-oxoisovalerate dehydrogenase E2 component (dihydrolipoyl transacylase)
MEDHTYTVTLPDIGEGVVEGEIVQWLKQEGDSLVQDEPVVVVMTDKATVELPTPHPGKLAKQHYRAGQIAIKGKPLYDLLLNEPVAKKGAVKQKEAAAEPKAPCPLARKLPVERNSQTTSEKKALPYVRKLAKELGIDINTLSGTGKEGRIELHDLASSAPHSALKTAQIAPQEGEVREAVIGIRKLMAKKMAESKRHIPHFSYFEQVDATRLVQLKQYCQKMAKEENLGQVTYMPLMIRALSMALKQYPQLNSSYDESTGELVIYPWHNIGIAVTTPLGLIVPVLKNVETQSLRDIVASYGTLRAKFKENQLQSGDMKGSTITISNFGGLQGGGLFATPIINHPEAAILAVGRVQPQPMVKQGTLAICQTLNLSWSFDHRIVDGDMAATFSAYLAKLLTNPAQLL